MGANKKKTNTRLAAQLVASVLLIAVFLCLGIWGAADCGNYSYKWLFVAGLSVFAALCVVAVNLMIRGFMAAPVQKQTAADEAWFDRTMNLSAMPSANNCVTVAYEITFIHSDFIVT